MVRKFGSLLLVAILILTVSSTSFAFEGKGISAEATLYENSYVDGDTLKAEESSSFNVDVNNLLIMDGIIKINGKIGENKDFNIVGQTNGNNIEYIEEQSHNFEVKNITVLEDIVVMYLGEENDTIRVKINYENKGVNLFYNKYWYTEFLEPQIETHDSNITLNSIITPNAYNTNYSIPYTRSFNVYGDLYTEEITLGFYYNWPEVVQSTSTGDDFTSKLQINDNKTYYTPYGSSKTYTLSGSSLEVAGATIRHATDAGQYVKNIHTSHVGTLYSGGGTSLGYSLGIPNLPVSINYSPPESVTITNGQNGYYSFNYPGNNKSQQYNISWEPSRYHLISKNDFFEAISRVQTDSTYKKTGRLRLSVEWSFTLVSSGINQGQGTPPYNKTDTFSNTLYYELQ